MKTRLLITGGTLDKVYNTQTGELEFRDSHVPAMLSQGRCHNEIITEVIFLKDSLDMVADDRELILEKCRACEEDRIIITHGTDTLVETATTLGESIRNKTIILLGAMVPWTVNQSDSLFNLGAAVAAASILPEGVYVLMHGRVFNWDNVSKNREKGLFESKQL